MIIDKQVKLKVTEKNISRAKIYQENSKIGDEIIVLTEKLFFSERVRINVKCDICGDEFMINNSGYNNNMRRNGYFGCIKCCKTKHTKETCFKKYGVEYISKVPSIIEKTKLTQLKNWGGHHMKNKDFFEKYKNDNIKKYGYEMPFNSKEILEKCTNTTKEKYGVDNVFKLDDIKEKIKKTLFDKYGSEHPLGSGEIRNKFISTMLEKYGVDNPSKYKEFKDKVINSKIKNGYTFNNSEWFQYKRDVRVITSKYRKEFLNNWDGYDYYDNEYIKENFNLNYYDRYYPTIDHKISTISGYIQNISPEIIGNINNLCYTKRFINSSKNYMSEAEFIKK